MRTWITCSMILLVMLATLSITPRLSLPNINGYFLVIFGTLILVLFILATLLRRLLFSRSSSHPKLSSHPDPNLGTIQKTLSTTPKRLNFLQFIVFVLLMLFAGLYSMHSVQRELTNELTQPMRVLATVKPVGLSDSNFNNIPIDSRQNHANQNTASPKLINTNYRQLAIIESARPLTLNELNGKDSSTSQLDYLKGKQVLLSARQPNFSKKSNLPKGFSKNFIGLNELQPTQQTQMILELKPLPSADKGFVHRWLRARHINAQAHIVAYDTRFIPLATTDWQIHLNQWRWQVREHFLGDNWHHLSTEEQQAKAVTLSLFTGDRALINKATKDLYQLAGISHLLAISGTHVLFLAIVLSTLVLFFVNRVAPQLYNRLPKSQLRWLVMVLGALLYALFTGFDVPSARTVYMLMAVGIARLLLLDIPSRQVLMIVAVMMAFADPYVLWQAGFWLSFVAVMLLISYDISVNQRANHEQFVFSNTYHTELEQSANLSVQFMHFAKLQLWIFLALLPLSLLLFGKVSLWGVLVNLFAIGLYGWVIVPLNLLAGITYPLLPSVADGIWQLVSWILELTHNSLSWLVGADEPSQSWLYTNINAGMMLIIGLLALPLLLPSKAISRVWSLPPLVLLITLIINQSNPTSHNPTDTLQPQLTLLNTSFSGANRYVNSQLFTHGDDNWLIIANHRPLTTIHTAQNKFNNQKSSPSNPVQTFNPTELAKQWQEQLGKIGVSALTGVIIQTPSLELLEASELLKKDIPIGFMWLAGKNQLANNAPDTQNIDTQSIDTQSSIPDYVLPCTMGRQWSNPDNTTSITAMTGWDDIADQGVWACALRIDSMGKPILLNNGYPLHWLTNANGEKDSQPQIKPVAENNNLEKVTTSHRIILNAGDKNGRLWQLWELLCPANDMLTVNKNLPSMLLTHSANDLPDELLKLDTSIQTWALLDKPTQYNHQKLPRILIDWQHKTERGDEGNSHFLDKK